MSIRSLPVLLSVLTGCATTSLVPAGTLARGPERDVGYAQGYGVQVWADGVWVGDPGNLPEYVTPVLVTIENNSGRPLRLAYEDFALTGTTGIRYAALPPFSITGRVSAAEPPPGTVVLAGEFHQARPVNPRPPPVVVQPFRPRIRMRGFYVAPPYAGFYVGMPVWGRPWLWNHGYYSRWGTAWPEFLPTRDMVQRALPEGALEPGGTVAGVVYFQNVRREGAVNLVISLREAGTALDLGTLTIPFAVRG